MLRAGSSPPRARPGRCRPSPSRWRSPYRWALLPPRVAEHHRRLPGRGQPAVELASYLALAWDGGAWRTLASTCGSDGGRRVQLVSSARSDRRCGRRVHGTRTCRSPSAAAPLTRLAAPGATTGGGPRSVAAPQRLVASTCHAARSPRSSVPPSDCRARRAAREMHCARGSVRVAPDRDGERLGRGWAVATERSRRRAFPDVAARAAAGWPTCGAGARRPVLVVAHSGLHPRVALRADGLALAAAFRCAWTRPRHGRPRALRTTRVARAALLNRRPCRAGA
jgi:hypothetical protein